MFASCPLLAADLYEVDDARIEPPQRVAGDAPAYPPEARNLCITGVVTLLIVVQKDGSVGDVVVVDDAHFGMDQIAKETVQEWLYQPGRLRSSGEAVEVNLPVAVRFENPCPQKKTGVVRVGGEIRPPKKLRSPDPVYTKEARIACVEGLVILESIINKQGDVTSVRTLKDLPAGLGAAARQAVRRWKYQPAHTPDGRPIDVIYTLTVNFSLGGQCKRGGNLQLKLLHSVEPEVEGITGEVSAAITIGRNGKVINVSIVDSTDKRLDKPVRKALSEWRYEIPKDPKTGRKTNAVTTVNLKF